MNDEIRKRLVWIKLYEETQDAGLVCRRCGISRPTLRKWWRRYQAEGEAGLVSQSRRPQTSPQRKVFEQEEQWILSLREERNLGARRIRHELIRLHERWLSLSTIQKVLDRYQVPPLHKVRRTKGVKRYQKDVPGERVQMDTCKIGPGLYQYTAVDDCTRFLIATLFPRRTAANTVDFLHQVIEQMPFPIQRLQTDRGREFTAYKVQDLLWDWGIKYRPTRPASPHLNGKVERAQQTLLREFYSISDLADDTLQTELDEWLFYYNWHRIHGTTGETPVAKASRLSNTTPTWDEIEAWFDPDQERARIVTFGPASTID